MQFPLIYVSSMLSTLTEHQPHARPWEDAWRWCVCVCVSTCECMCGDVWVCAVDGNDPE